MSLGVLKAVGLVLLIIVLLATGLWIFPAIYLVWKLVRECRSEPNPRFPKSVNRAYYDGDLLLAGVVGYHLASHGEMGGHQAIQSSHETSNHDSYDSEYDDEF